MLLVFFFSLGLLLILNHALWQDEWQAWLLARGSGSLAELFRNLRYEGHPALWYLALYGLSHLTDQPLAMQLFHLFLATTTVYVFLRFSPFTRLQKILFVFGYFPFFEYAVISRNYAWGILLIFTFCAIFPRSFSRKYLVLTSLLFLLCQTSIYGLLVALALGAAFLIGDLTANRPKIISSKAEIITAGVILGAGVLISIWQLLPPSDSGFAVGWRFHLDWPAALRTMGVIWDSYVPVPSLHYQFWNTNLIGNQYFKLILSLLVLGFSFMLFLRQPAVLALFGLGTLALLSFTYTKYFGAIRHHGHLFILFLAAVWLSAYFPAGTEKPGFFNKIANFCRQRGNAFLTSILVAQLLAGLLAAALGLIQPFSAGKETAAYINASGIGRMLIAGDADDAASVISGYLRQPIFYLCAGRWGSYVIWDQQRKTLEIPEVLKKARELAVRYRQEVLLVLNREIASTEPGIIPLRQFRRSIVPAEAFYLYLVNPPGGSPGP
jgi:hypothetical protein